MKLNELHQYWKTLKPEDIEAQMNKFNAGIMAVKLNPNLTLKEVEEALQLPAFLKKCIEEGLDLTEEEKELLK